MATPDEMGQEILRELRKSESTVDYDKIDALIASGANLSALNQQGQPPLIVSIAHGHTRASLAFIRAGADVELGSEDSPPLHLAAYYGALSVVKALLEKGADAERLNDKDLTAQQVAEDKRLDREDSIKKFPRLNMDFNKSSAELENYKTIERLLENHIAAQEHAAQRERRAMEDCCNAGLPLTRDMKVRKKPVSFKKN